MTTETDQVHVYVGTLVHSTETENMQILEDSFVAYKQGKIQQIGHKNDLENFLTQYNEKEKDVTYMKSSQFLMPGLIDTHIHASQYCYTGTALDLELLDWLEKYTFPVESSFKDLAFAEDAYTKAVQRVLKNGTTTACYFATIHTDATLKLCDIIEKFGQRAYVGKVNMDYNSPEYYIEDVSTSIAETQRFVESVLAKKNPLITPVITPRYAGSCSMDLMKKLAHLAAQQDLPIQSHISESKNEIEMVCNELHPGYENYTDIYDKAGILTNKTVMAHGVYLSDKELEVFKARGSALSHCPNSNLSLRSGILDVRNVLNNGVKVGLGTDVSGGYHPSMLDAIRHAIQASKVLKIFHTNPDIYKAIDYKDAFKLATLSGAQALGLEKEIGNFEVGKCFDAILIDSDVVNSPYDVFSRDTLADRIQKFIFLGDDRNIVDIFVNGILVTSS